MKEGIFTAQHLDEGLRFDQIERSPILSTDEWEVALNTVVSSVTKDKGRWSFNLFSPG